MLESTRTSPDPTKRPGYPYPDEIQSPGVPRAMVAAMAKYLIELELEIEDSRRSPADTRARALKAGRSIAAWAARLRHARVLWAQLESPHGRIHKLIEEEEPHHGGQEIAT